MAFSHPTRHFHKPSLELLILAATLVLTLLSLWLIHLLQTPTQERAVPQPTIADPKLPLHFSKLQGTQNITEPTFRLLSPDTKTMPLKAALLQLLDGPNPAEKEAGLYSEIPAGTQLLDITAKNGKVTVNLSKEFIAGGGSTSMIQRVQEIEKTVLTVEQSSQVEIAIEGKPLKVLGGEGLELN